MAGQQLDYLCRKCNKYIVCGPNSWLRISGSTSVLPEDQDALDWAANPYRLDERPRPGTLELEGCSLSSLICIGNGCNKRLGLKCVGADRPDKRGYVGQIILKEPHLKAKVRGSTHEIAFNIKDAGDTSSSNPKEVQSSKTQYNGTPKPVVAERLKSTDRASTIQEGSSNIPTHLAQSHESNEAGHENSLQTRLLLSQAKQLSDVIESTSTEAFQHPNVIKNLFERQQEVIAQLSQQYVELRQDYDRLNDEVLHIRDINGVAWTELAASRQKRAPHAPTKSSLNPHRVLRQSENQIGITTQHYLKEKVQEDHDSDFDYIPNSTFQPSGSMVGSAEWDARVQQTPLSNHHGTPPDRDIVTPRGTRRRGRPRTSPYRGRDTIITGITGKRLGTPPWEKPEWDPQQYPEGYQPFAKTSIKRRGVSKPGSSSYYSPYMDHVQKKQKKTENQEKPRDEEGYILMANGKRDGRSVRGRSLKGVPNHPRRRTFSPADNQSEITTPGSSTQGHEVSRIPGPSHKQTSGTFRKSLGSHLAEEINESITLESDVSSANNGSGKQDTPIPAYDPSLSKEHIDTPPDHKKVMQKIFPYGTVQ